MFLEVRSMKIWGVTLMWLPWKQKGWLVCQGGPTTRFTQAHSLTGIKSITSQPGSKTTYNIFCNIWLVRLPWYCLTRLLWVVGVPRWSKCQPYLCMWPSTIHDIIHTNVPVFAGVQLVFFFTIRACKAQKAVHCYRLWYTVVCLFEESIFVARLQGCACWINLLV